MTASKSSGGLPASRDWTSAFRVLALKRTQPLWRAAGLPSELIASPAGVTSAAREFLVATRGESDPDKYVAAVARTLSRLELEYGADVAESVSVWARLHFVRSQHHDRIDSWSGFLLSLLRRQRSPAPEDTLRIAPDRKDRLLTDLHVAFGDPEDELLKLEESAGRVPLTPVEEAVLQRDTPEAPTDIYVPGVTDAALAVQREITLAAWRHIESLLEPQELFEFVRWARELAPALRVNPERLEPLKLS